MLFAFLKIHKSMRWRCVGNDGMENARQKRTTQLRKDKRYGNIQTLKLLQALCCQAYHPTTTVVKYTLYMHGPITTHTHTHTHTCSRLAEG